MPTAMAMSDVAFIGLGVMGKPMAGHLLRGGHALRLHSRSGVPGELTAAGGTACKSPREAAERAEFVVTMLPDTPDVELVLFGPAGVAEGLRRGSVVLDMSSISPAATRGFAERVRGMGCDYVDAPVSGGEVGARGATLTIMVGASAAAFQRVLPLLQLMGKNITRIGDPGAGQVCKVANQILVALHIEAAAEALLFASKAGVDPATVRQALLGGFAASRVLEVHGERMIRRTFDPGFRIELHQKDLGLALDNARRMGLALPATALAQELLNACRAQGGARWDHSALVKALESLSAHALG